MLTRVSSKGQTVIPAAIREAARIRAGDELDVGFSGGLVVMRKRRKLSPADVKKLLLQGQHLPLQTEEDEDRVSSAIERVRRRARRA
jgi:AbrB family looped-hinge helix DNA binding protein